MESKLASALQLKYHGVGIIRTEQKPENVLEFQETRWGCIITMLAQAALGKITAFSEKTYGCVSGGYALGYGNTLENFTGGIECFYHFLSDGNETWEEGRKIIENELNLVRRSSIDHFIHGERYLKTPELVQKSFEQIPLYNTEKEYVLFKPLNLIEDEIEKPETVVFLANPNQLSGLIVIANYGRETIDNVYAPFGGGCHTIVLLPYLESFKEEPKAIIGLSDPSARLYMSHLIGTDLMSFAVPYKMYKEMEDNVEGSFFEMDTWNRLMEVNSNT